MFAASGSALTLCVKFDSVRVDDMWTDGVSGLAHHGSWCIEALRKSETGVERRGGSERSRAGA